MKVWPMEYKILTADTSDLIADPEDTTLDITKWTEVASVKRQSSNGFVVNEDGQDIADTEANTDTITVDTTPALAKEVQLQRYVLVYITKVNAQAPGNNVNLREIEIFDDTVNVDVNAVLDSISAQDMLITDGKVTVNTKAAGAKIYVRGSDLENVIDNDGNLNGYNIGDREVTLIVRVENAKDPSQYAEKNVTVIVPDQRQAYPKEYFPETAEPNAKPEVIPSLQEWYGYSGKFELSQATRIIYNDAAGYGIESAAANMKTDLLDITGMDLAVTLGTAADAGENDIYIESQTEDTYKVGDEGYFMVTDDSGLRIYAPSYTGCLYGTISVEQILYQADENRTVPKGVIRDYPAYENAAKLIIESEDHSTRNTFTINLGVKALTSDPEDGSRDYPAGNIMATAGSEYTDGNSATDGSADWALDNNLNTWWHTNWAGGHASGLEERWLTLDLGSVQKIDGYRYYSRSGQSNGRVGGYMIEVSTDGAEWTTSAEGTWENTVGWKLAEFDAVDARYVRLTGVTTYGDGAQQNMFMTATEARVRLAADTTDISSAEVTVPKVKEATVVDEVHPITLSADEITVTLDGKELRYGVDYVVSYENNTAEGTATAVVSGLGQYGYLGTVSAEFAIKVSEGAEITAAGITVKNAPSKNIYTEGETLDPSGLILTAGYSDGSEEDIVYSDETVDGFTFTPNLDTALTAGRITVKVGYDGFETMFDITVNEKPIAIVSVEVAKEPDKTAYTEGETLDPSGLVLHVEYSNGSAGTIGYNSETAGWFGFTPALGTALMSDIKEVTVTYQNHKVMFDITVSEKPTDPEAPDKPDAEDPDKPTGEGPQRPETGRDSQSGDKAVQTGDASNMKVWAGAAVLAGAAIVTAGRKRRSEK